MEFADGAKVWYQHGKIHRDDGPASEHAGGTEWLQHGHYHRDDGPAVEYSDGAFAEPV